MNVSIATNLRNKFDNFKKIQQEGSPMGNEVFMSKRLKTN